MPTTNLLVDVPAHNLVAGANQLLQDTRNWSAVHAGSWAHLNVNLRLREGGRYLLLGKNGCGKSTLLKNIHGKQLFDDSDVPWPSNVTTFLVDQELAFLNSCMDKNAVDTVLAQSPLMSLEREAELLSDKMASLEIAGEASASPRQSNDVEKLSLRLCEIYEEIENLGETDTEAERQKVESILTGLGFTTSGSNNMTTKTISELSGGWQMRVALACALFQSPRLLLLDEPNNHLDLPGIKWLVNYLTKVYTGTILCVSHDRYFINAVSTDIIIFANCTLNYFHGNLDEFEVAAVESQAGVQKQVDAFDKKRAHVEKSVNLMKQQAARKHGDQKKSNQVASRVKKLGRMGLEKVDGKKFNSHRHGIRQGASNENDGGYDKHGKMSAAPIIQREDPGVKFTFKEALPLGMSEDSKVIEVKSVSFRYSNADGAPKKSIFKNVELALTVKSRVAIVGKNGEGKSTLMKVLTSELTPTTGSVTRHHNLKLAVFSQHHAQELLELCNTNPNLTPFSYMQECFPLLKDQEIYTLLGSFGLPGSRLATQPINTLSGGQRVRIIFAKIAHEKPHFLVLDEPTNSLDVYSIDALTDALKFFEGGILVISHNQALLTALECECYVVDKKLQQVNKVDGGFPAYLKTFEKSKKTKLYARG